MSTTTVIESEEEKKEKEEASIILMCAAKGTFQKLTFLKARSKVLDKLLLHYFP